jgi:hypothetical protein
LISGILGGIIGGWISFRLFVAQKRYQTKHEDSIEKRNALREMIPALQKVLNGIHLDWNSQEDIKQLNNQIARWRTLFFNDQQVLSIIQRIDLLIGVAKESFYGETAMIKEKPSQIVESIENAIKEKIDEIEKSVT